MKGEFSTDLIQRVSEGTFLVRDLKRTLEHQFGVPDKISQTQAPESWRSTSPTLCNFHDVLFPDVLLWRGNNTQAFGKVHTLLCVPVGICIQQEPCKGVLQNM